MSIRKLFTFNGMHIVRNCSSDRCKYNQHSHTYTVEVFFEAQSIDNGYMILDFGLVKNQIKDLIKSFDKSYTLWDKESQDYVEYLGDTCNRIVTIPVSPSAEMYSYLLLFCIDKIVKNINFKNGEDITSLKVSSVRVHETETGYAETFSNELTNGMLPVFGLSDIKFTSSIIDSWVNPNMWDDLVNENKWDNPVVVQQIGKD